MSVAGTKGINGHIVGYLSCLTTYDPTSSDKNKKKKKKRTMFKVVRSKQRKSTKEPVGKKITSLFSSVDLLLAS